MSLRTLLIAGLLVAMAVTGLVYTAMQLDPPPREERRIKSAPPGARLDVGQGTTEKNTALESTPRPGADREPPRLPRAPADPDAPFADEPRDDDWAPAREAVVGARVDALLGEVRGADEAAVDVTAIECRSLRCQLTIAGTDPGKVQALVEALQGERGFYGDAEQIMLGSMKEENGRRELRATLLYAAE